MIHSDIIANKVSFYASISTFYYTEFNLYFYNCNFSYNYGTSVGAVYAALHFGGLIYFNNSFFENNILDINTFGGAVANLYGELHITILFFKNCSFINNYSSKKGGVFAILYGDLYDSDSVYINNTSINGGTAFISYNNIYNLTNCSLKNSKSQFGGVLSIMASSIVKISHSFFIGNYAENGGCFFGDGFKVEMNVKHF